MEKKNNTDDQSGNCYVGEFWQTMIKNELDYVVRPMIGRTDYYYDEWSRPIDMLWVDAVMNIQLYIMMLLCSGNG